MERSSNYVATIPNDELAAEKIAKTRQIVRDANRVLRDKRPAVWSAHWKRDWVRIPAGHRVSVYGRLGKDSKHARLYRIGGYYHRRSSQRILLEHASRIDVYLTPMHIYVPPAPQRLGLA
jgi:hypothetical protein